MQRKQQQKQYSYISNNQKTTTTPTCVIRCFDTNSNLPFCIGSRQHVTLLCHFSEVLPWRHDDTIANRKLHLHGNYSHRGVKIKSKIVLRNQCNLCMSLYLWQQCFMFLCLCRLNTVEIYIGFLEICCYPAGFVAKICLYIKLQETSTFFLVYCSFENTAIFMPQKDSHGDDFNGLSCS